MGIRRVLVNQNLKATISNPYYIRALGFYAKQIFRHLGLIDLFRGPPYHGLGKQWTEWNP